MYDLLHIKRSAVNRKLGVTTMAKYKTLEAFSLNGVDNEVGAEVELSESEAAELGAKVEPVKEDAGEGAGEDADKGAGEDTGAKQDEAGAEGNGVGA